MAIRNLRLDGDPILRKTSRSINEINDKIQELIEDMIETMYENEGVGLAAPQVGVLKRLVIVDVGISEDEEEDLGKGEDIPDGPIVLINPEIIEQDGEQIGTEGCLSVPDRSGEVKRPSHIKVRAKNEKFEDIEFEARNFFARAICHEVDHLNGILYIDKLEEEK